MRFKKIMILTIILSGLLAISAVSAADNSTSDVVGVEETTDQVVSVENDLNVLCDGVDYGNYSQIASEISSYGKLQHQYYTYDTGSTITIDEYNKVIDGSGAVIDMTGSTIRAFYVVGSGVTIKNLTIKNANFDGYDGGGAIYFSSSGTVENCNFTNNSARYGGAIWMSSGSVENCNFTNNSARYCGAVYFDSNGNVTNCNFTNNKATYNGGAIWMSSGSVENCNFTNNIATNDNGGAIWMSSGSVENCNLTNNSARHGGAVYFLNNGNVANCNFINNKAIDGDGGAISMTSGSVENCNFTNNNANNGIGGGAVYFSCSGSVENCNFTNNSARYGGAIEMSSGSVENCNFTNNSARYGGAIRMSLGSVENCNFTNNKATDGGAILMSLGSVENCNFINNKAIDGDGGAVYFLNNGNVTNCNFTNNSDKYGYSIYGGTVSNCTFVGDVESQSSKYPSSATNGSLTKEVKVDSVIIASNVKVTYNAGSYYTIRVNGTDGKPASGVAVIILGKISKTLTTKDGIAKFKITQVPGTYKITITALGKSVSKTITVKKATPKITAKAKSFKKSVKTKKYAVKLNVNQKVKVAIKVNKKIYCAYTNTKGQATFKITKLTKKGKYIATVSSVGNNCYNKAKSVNVKINVK